MKENVFTNNAEIGQAIEELRKELKENKYYITDVSAQNEYSNVNTQEFILKGSDKKKFSEAKIVYKEGILEFSVGLSNQHHASFISAFATYIKKIAKILHAKAICSRAVADKHVLSIIDNNFRTIPIHLSSHVCNLISSVRNEAHIIELEKDYISGRLETFQKVHEYLLRLSQEPTFKFLYYARNLSASIQVTFMGHDWKISIENSGGWRLSMKKEQTKEKIIENMLVCKNETKIEATLEELFDWAEMQVKTENLFNPPQIFFIKFMKKCGVSKDSAKASFEEFMNFMDPEDIEKQAAISLKNDEVNRMGFEGGVSVVKALGKYIVFGSSQRKVYIAHDFQEAKSVAIGFAKETAKVKYEKELKAIDKSFENFKER